MERARIDAIIDLLGCNPTLRADLVRVIEGWFEYSARFDALFARANQVAMTTRAVHGLIESAGIPFGLGL